MTMDELKPGQSAYILTVGGSGALRHHLLDMGLTPKTEVTLQKIAPMGDPVQIELRGYELTLRLDEAQKIQVERLHQKTDRPPSRRRAHPAEHPGMGELVGAAGYHSHDGAGQIPEGERLTFALAGNQNCGKTTLFNQLTGSNQHVGNFPGVTVDRKDGAIRSHPEAVVTDLPGIYSLSPYSSEEIVTRDFLMDTHPNGIINIVDATNMERNLYLTMQIMELGIPMVLALNMMDEVRANGGSVRVNELERILGIPVVPISAAKNEGIEELIDHAIHVARYREVPKRMDFCPASSDESDPVGAVHRCIHAAVHIIEPEALEKDLPVRFTATKLVENDSIIAERLALSPEKRVAFDQLVSMLEQETGLDREAALANMRFRFIESLCAETVVRPRESREHKRSMIIDRVLTGKYTAIPCFVGIMVFVFAMTFSWIGAALSDLMSLGVDGAVALLERLLTAAGVNEVVRSLVIDGICSGVGSVLSFLPTIVTLFFFLSILEDTGYMARVAFVMDRLLRRIGLPLHPGGHRVYGPGGLCDGPAAAEDRPFRPEHRSHAHRLWMLGAGHYGHPDPLQRAGPQDDHPADPLYELHRQAPHLLADGRGFLPPAVPGAGDGGALPVGHPLRHPLRPCPEKNHLPGGAGPLCDGAAQLPPPLGQERATADLGKGQGLHQKSLYHHLCRLYRYLVSANL